MLPMTRFLTILAILVSGCATSGMDEGERFEQLIKTGQCDKAESIAVQKQSGAELYLLRARIAGDCRRDQAKAVQYLTISAKMGNTDAAKLLRGLGKPVPEVQIGTTRPVTIETPNVAPEQTQGNGGYSRCARGPQGSLTCYRSDGSGTRCRPVGIQVQCREL